VEVQAHAEGYAPGEAIATVVEAGGTTDLPAPLVLGAACGLGGRVFAPDGSPLAGTLAVARRTHRHGGDVDSTVSDAGGRYWFPRLPDGEYAVGLWHRDWRGLELPAVRFDPGRRTLLPDATLSPGAAIRGRVTTPDGRPVAGARVLVPRGFPVLEGSEADELYGALGVPASDSDGRFLVAGLPEGLHFLLVTAPGFRPWFCEGIETTGEAPAGLLVVLDPGGAVSGRVEDGTGAPVAGAFVYLADFPGLDGLYVDVGGRATIRLAPGPHRVIVHATGLPHRAFDVVVGGETEIPLVLPAGGALRLTITDRDRPAPGVSLRVDAEGLWLASGRTGPDGTTLVRALPAGSVRVSVRAPDGRRAEVEARIEEGVEVPITIPLRDE
jgi:hypothetical protein